MWGSYTEGNICVKLKALLKGDSFFYLHVTLSFPSKFVCHSLSFSFDLSLCWTAIAYFVTQSITFLSWMLVTCVAKQERIEKFKMSGQNVDWGRTGWAWWGCYSHYVLVAVTELSNRVTVDCRGGDGKVIMRSNGPIQHTITFVDSFWMPCSSVTFICVKNAFN